MRFTSTRTGQDRIAFSEALTAGIAPDGGLYVPTEWPSLSRSELTVPGAEEPLAALAQQVLGPFLAGDVLQHELPAIVQQAFDFPAPQLWLDAERRLGVLELFHGPTAAFKDFGARFLAAAFTRLRRAADRPLHILVATSGDTGGAVAAAFHRQPGVEVAVLFPKGLVSPTQERQLTCWDGNVRSLAVRGRFDDCQRLVKEAFADHALRQRYALSSANSINIGRLLPQTVYYWAASLRVWSVHGEPASFVIPSGNLGNATACVWARRLGAPIGDIVLAHNANRTVPDYLETGTLRPRASEATLSSAMDVGQPSNLERLNALYPDVGALRGALAAVSIDDAATAARISSDYRRYGRIWCPHTAVAAEAYARLAPAQRAQGRWLLVATAHPAKFREIVEPLIGATVPVPPQLARLFERPARSTEIAPTLAALKAEL
ncbi:MAG TPA: threonine synthase [Steroidobacteraceae bacterium]|nr:threonine synthase [Steroidobacteraceae bacterium]